jgi:hypothetical protein
MGLVWKVLDTHLDRFVALKNTLPCKTSRAGTQATLRAGGQGGFRVEHPTIVPLLTSRMGISI